MDSLKEFLPQKSYDTVSYWLKKYNCTLSIKKPRTTKLGDYRFHKNKHYISINNNLNPYSFLLTLTHEIAHMVVAENYSPRVLPHGIEWKNEFKKLMIGFIPIFPIKIQQCLAKHLKNPKSSSSSDYELVKALREYDKNPTLTISDIPNGSKFFTPNGKMYLKEKKIKTRFQCKSLNNNRTYLFNPLAEVRI
jgi:SprT protein